MLEGTFSTLTSVILLLLLCFERNGVKKSRVVGVFHDLPALTHARCKVARFFLSVTLQECLVIEPIIWTEAQFTLQVNILVVFLG